MHRKGKYKIDLVASNALKEIEEETITVYVTDEPDCYPPMVTILGRYQDRVSCNIIFFLDEAIWDI